MHHAILYTHESELPDLTEVAAVDLVREEHDKLTIDAVRELTRLAQLRPTVPDGTRLLVVVANTVNQEAQNALLKILEEPPASTRFYFVVRDQSRLLPTLLSRFMKSTESNSTDSAVAVDFVTAPYAERLALVAKQVEAKDMLWQNKLLSGLELLLLHRKLPVAAAPVLWFVAARLRGPGASPKLLLEHLALSLPQQH